MKLNHNNAANQTAAARVGDREITITRVFETPRDLVFEAWTKAEHLAKWWGPRGFTSTFQEFDMKPGGTWQFMMHGPDGVDFPNTNVIVDVIHPERIVIKHTVFPHFEATALFEDQEGKTKLTYSTIYEETAEVFDKVKIYAAPGAEEMLDCLEEHLESMAGK